MRLEYMLDAREEIKSDFDEAFIFGSSKAVIVFSDKVLLGYKNWDEACNVMRIKAFSVISCLFNDK